MSAIAYLTRLASPTDSDEFLAMMYEHLCELRRLGSEIQPSEATLDHFFNLFVSYVNSTLDEDTRTEFGLEAPLSGVVAVLDLENVVQGFSMAGEIGPQLVDTDFGRVAIGHGTYIRPAYRGRGLSRELRDLVRRELKSRGFDTIVGGVHLNNSLGAASLKSSSFSWYQLVGYERL